MPRKKKPPVQLGFEHERAPTFIRAWRKFRDLTQEELADRIEIDRTTVGRVENGIVPYDADFLDKVALALGCSRSDLLDTDPLKPDAPKLVYDRLRNAPIDVQQRALIILDALLKAG